MLCGMAKKKLNSGSQKANNVKVGKRVFESKREKEDQSIFITPSHPRNPTPFP
jgi:hypothetical protein